MPASAVSHDRQTFRKSERLSSRKLIRDLALKGRNIHSNPLRLIWLKAVLSEKVPAQAAFTVPKKNIKDAVDRNRIKRRMREAYRKNKSSFYSLISKNDLQYAFLFVFTGKEEITFKETEAKTKLILTRFAEDIQKNNP